MRPLFQRSRASLEPPMTTFHMSVILVVERTFVSVLVILGIHRLQVFGKPAMPCICMNVSCMVDSSVCHLHLDRPIGSFVLNGNTKQTITHSVVLSMLAGKLHRITSPDPTHIRPSLPYIHNRVGTAQ